MWIRSQDKKELIDITGKRVYVWVYKGWKIYIDPMTTEEDNTICMGEYGDDEARAVEVLDKIQEAIFYDSLGQKTMYRMPPKQEEK